MKNFVSLFILTISIIVFSGCTGSKELSFVKNPNGKNSLKVVYIPELNTVSKAELGQSMFEKMNVFIADTYLVTLEEPIDTMHSQATGKFAAPIGTQGMLQIDNVNKWKASCVKGIHHDYRVCLFDINDDSYFDKAGSTINTLYTELAKPILYSTKERIIANKDSFKIMALYQGKQGNTIKVSFREFKNDFARPAFTQDIEYELEKDKPTIIGFKGLRIEVLEATNLDIKYKVIKDFN